MEIDSKFSGQIFIFEHKRHVCEFKKNQFNRKKKLYIQQFQL